eukprot:CAMPEP_0174259104 /NCGR_PEP_ID=MMETSP0439-20130205/7982_1 /TAXON_ID=0 /ORGANISM="Stereomyxa ramosa, Strain Chinc5" /LENGTH=353 /DNA_ID=CAMNT_0015342873 /DNA_START=62 /DNA_END=1123 /DNA_ORIENTATION=-
MDDSSLSWTDIDTISSGTDASDLDEDTTQPNGLRVSGGARIGGRAPRIITEDEEVGRPIFRKSRTDELKRTSSANLLEDVEEEGNNKDEGKAIDLSSQVSGGAFISGMRLSLDSAQRRSPGGWKPSRSPRNNDELITQSVPVQTKWKATRSKTDELKRISPVEKHPEEEEFLHHTPASEIYIYDNLRRKDADAIRAKVEKKKRELYDKEYKKVQRSIQQQTAKNMKQSTKQLSRREKKQAKKIAKKQEILEFYKGTTIRGVVGADGLPIKGSDERSQLKREFQEARNKKVQEEKERAEELMKQKDEQIRREVAKQITKYERDLLVDAEKKFLKENALFSAKKNAGLGFGLKLK